MEIGQSEDQSEREKEMEDIKRPGEGNILSGILF